jgi:hypothetical protein
LIMFSLLEVQVMKLLGCQLPVVAGLSFENHKNTRWAAPRRCRALLMVVQNRALRFISKLRLRCACVKRSYSFEAVAAIRSAFFCTTRCKKTREYHKNANEYANWRQTHEQEIRQGEMHAGYCERNGLPPAELRVRRRIRAARACCPAMRQREDTWRSLFE